MDSEKVLKANEAIRQLLDKYPYGFLPNPAARQDAEREMKIIRESSPDSCIEILHSLADWLDRLFVPKDVLQIGLSSDFGVLSTALTPL